VGDIGRMVDEFSSFARMPKPVFEPADLSEIVKQSVFLVEVANQDIEFSTEIPDRMPGSFDQRLLSQAVANIVKNATEAIGGRLDVAEDPGRIWVKAKDDGEAYCVRIIDNGIGLPASNRQKLLEPYMTTRDKGTGLGLAIVRKILQEHGGSIQLKDACEVSEFARGACIEMRILKDSTRPDDDASGTGDGDHNSGLALSSGGATARLVETEGD